MHAQARSPDMKYFPQNERNLVPIELHIGKHTVIQTTGKPTSDKVKPTAFKSVDFTTILSSEGAVKIEGYLKDAFIISSANRMTHIINAITDGEHKINIIVKNATEETVFAKYQKGDKVQVVGLMDVDGNKTLFCNYFQIYYIF